MNKDNSVLKRFFQKLLLSNKAFLMVIILFILMMILSPVFLTKANLLNLLRQICTNTIVALAFTFIIGSGHIDLSVGSIVGFVGVVVAIMMRDGCPIWISIVAGLALGAAIGAVNALVISAFDLPAFVVTLAMQSLFRGLIYIVTKLVPIVNLPKQFLFIGQGRVFGFPVPVIIMIVMIVIMYIVANRTMFGRYVIAMGGNKEATRASGISIFKTRIMIYVVMGLCSAISGIVLTARVGSATVGAGEGMELDAISAVVIGGTSMAGGNVNVIGTVFGALIIGLCSNGMNLLGIQTNYQIISKGLLILLALILDSVTAKSYEKIRKKQALAALEKKLNSDI